MGALEPALSVRTRLRPGRLRSAFSSLAAQAELAEFWKNGRIPLIEQFGITGLPEDLGIAGYLGRLVVAGNQGPAFIALFGYRFFTLA